MVLDRAERGNVIDLSFCDAFDASLERTGDDTIRCVLLRASGRNFCVGGDVAAFSVPEPGEAVRTLAERLHDGLRALVDIQIPVVAAVQGWCAGAGFSLALTADILLVDETTRFKSAYGSLGLTPDGGLSWHLPRRVPISLAKDLLFSDRVLTSVEAIDHGVAARLYASDKLPGSALEYAVKLANRSRTAGVRTKQLLTASAGESLLNHLDTETEAIAASAEEFDGREGVAAFLEGRPARFPSTTQLDTRLR